MKPVFALLTLLLLGACTDPITVGSDLLGDDRAGVGESTAIPFSTRVVEEDSLFILNGTSDTISRYVLGPNFSFGELDEPTFGKTTHSVYIVPWLPRDRGVTVLPPFVTRGGATIDSVVLILPIDTLAGIYGPGRTFPFRATELTENVEINGTDYYSTFTRETLGADLGGAATFSVSTTPIPVRDTTITSGAPEYAHARIPLSLELGNRFQGYDASVYESDAAFKEVFSGLYLTPSGPTDAIVNFQLTDPQNVTPYSGLNVYYSDSTGSPRFYRLPVQLAIPNYAYDYANALVEPLLDEEADNDLVAIAGKGSLMTEINFGDLSQWEGTVINRATLEIPVADVVGVDYDEYPIPRRVELFYRPSSSGPLIAIQDKIELIRTRALAPNANFFLDGNLRTEGDAAAYEVSFSLHMQRIIDGEVPPRLYLRAYPLDQSDYAATSAALFEPVAAKDVARVLLNGPDAPNNPARVRITFTELN
ncbi:DUF4270 family protein [Lewinella sp. IMCC34191]|uniref:DUF4270 family protein n=1 Tax=Lewinella sp. IMCC34191 TaxID=2259172 RepID=UPI000E2837F9|nr:DUF4270 family protein [Lewinella sp. IMCC34191]